MMPKEVKNSLLIIAACLLTFLWSKTPLAKFSLQLSALLFVFFIVFRRFFKKTIVFVSLEAIFFTILVLVLVFDTGGLSSPLFFLVYLLLFSLSLLLSPSTAFILSLALIILLLSTLSEIKDFKLLLPLFSLPFITPLAVFFGREHLKLKSVQKELDHDESQTLFWITTTFKEHLKTISELLLKISNNNLTVQQKENLKAIDHHVKRLKTLGQKLKKEIEGRME